LSAATSRPGGTVRPSTPALPQESHGALSEGRIGHAGCTEMIRESASEASDFLRTTIEQRPYTTAAVALGIGFLIGRLGRRGDY
jgi:ElaB/YqjD/DUF883 family membrane-anchored ribosome-binding protein